MNQVIEHTRDYSQFKTITGNRGVQKAHVKKLMTAIEQDPETIKFNPIIVNENMEVIDGQHRLEALKELARNGVDQPAYYIVAPGRTLEDVQAINSGRKAWSPLDYAYSYVERGNRNYQRYLDLRKEFGINHDVLLVYLSGEEITNTATMFKEGNLKVDDFEFSYNLSKYLHRYKPHYKNWHKRPFALAIRQLWFSTMNLEELFDRVVKYGSNPRYPDLNLVDYPTPREYLIRLTDIYNFKKSKNKFSLTI